MADGTFHWELIDHRLVGSKLTNLAEEMSESIRAEIGQIQFDNIGNSNSQTVRSQMIAMHLRRTDEWIEKTYNAYCEVWEKQGHPKTAAFIRAVSSHAIATIISARTNAVVAELSARRARTGSQIEPHNARIESFKRSMSRLAARWARKLEIEARECAHSEMANHSEQGRFDQQENLRRAIAGRKAEIERINRSLDNLAAPGSSSRFGKAGQISQRSIANIIQRRQEHEAALAELEREEARLATLGAQAGEARGRDQMLPAEALATAQQTLTVNPMTYRSPYEGLKPEMKVVDFSNAMLSAHLTDKQYDAYSLAKEYQRPMTEVEQRMGLTRKTIHEHIAAAEKAMKKVSLQEYRAKTAAKYKRPE